MTIAKLRYAVGCVFFIFVFLGISTYVSATPTVTIASADPSTILVGVLTSVVVSARIEDTTLITSSVNIQKLDANNKVTAILGYLHDNGSNGDKIAGDKVFSHRFTITGSTPGQIKLRVSAAFRGLLTRKFSDVIIIDVIHSPTNLDPPADPISTTTSGGGLALSFTSARYIGAVELPPEIPLDSATLRVVAGVPSRTSPVFPGEFFSLRLNIDSSVLLRLEDQESNIILLTVFPKHPHLNVQNPILSPFSTAVAMVFLQPGVAVNDPILAAVLLKKIANLPETASLAALLSNKMLIDPSIISHPDGDVLIALNEVLTAIVNPTDPIDPECDTNSTVFRDADGRNGDNVCVDASGFDIAALRGTFSTLNFSSRWVFHFVDRNINGSQVVDNIFLSSLEGASLPRKFAVPGVIGIFQDIVEASFESFVDVFHDVFKGDVSSETLREILNNFTEQARSYYDPQQTRFEATVPMEGKYFFTSYTFGLHAGDAPAFFQRMVGPTLLTLTTEIGLPLVSLIADVNSKLFFPNNLDFVKTAELLETIVAVYLPRVERILTDAQAGNNFDAFKQALELLRDLALDRHFIEWLARHSPFGPDLISEALSTVVQDILSKLSPLGIIDLGIKGINVIVPGVLIIHDAIVFDAFDKYFLDAVVVPSPPPPNVGCFSSHFPGGYYVQLYVLDLNKVADSITVTGPGLVTPFSLTYGAYRPGEWWSVPNVFLGKTLLQLPPLTYTFHINSGGQIYTIDNVVYSFVDELATNLSPRNGEIVLEPLTFTWTGISLPDIKYQVQLDDNNYNRIWNSEITTGNSIPYTGPVLLAGATYRYYVVAMDSYGNQSLAQGWFINFKGPIAWLSFVEGNPGIPSDGVYVNALGGELNFAFELASPIPLGQFTDGFTITVFLPSNIGDFQNVSFSIINLKPTEPCKVHFGAGAGLPSGTTLFNGVEGKFTNIPQSFIQYWVNVANQYEPGCDLTANDLFVGKVYLHRKTLGEYVTTLDAAAILPGQNAVPSEGIINLPKTGQTTCYDESGNIINCTGTGQDGEIQAGVPWPSPRFTDNGDGTITDNLTGLMWTKDADLPGSAKTWQEALDYMVGMNAGTYPNLGYHDWRLPNRKELRSLIEHGGIGTFALPMSNPFINVQVGNYWSSTSGQYRADYAIAISIAGGYASSTHKSNLASVWLVRAGENGVVKLPQTGQTICYNEAGTAISCSGTGQDGDLQMGVVWPKPRFTDHGDGTITDNLTGFMWTKNANLMASRDPIFDNDEFTGDGIVYWQNALDYVAKLNQEAYLGYTDWRLPNIKELESLIDAENINPESDTVLPLGHSFSNVAIYGNGYWSSTTSGKFPEQAWIFNTISGSTSSLFIRDKTEWCSFAWPVRGGQVEQPNRVPDPPTGLSQFKSDGVTPIPAGGTIISRTVIFKGNVSDPDGDQVKLQIELRLTSEAFAGVATHESGFVSSGSTASITVSNLSNGQYQWRGRAVDSNGATSAWVDAGFAGADFIVSVPIWHEI